ncbi:MAG: LytTR family DNA-binding domain-containing protein [Zoogloeaceae bacterium]|jgi:two-component system response regulator AlgR|nr:LytTR family DNA-binding domain-containing protein [Zoogloeaceae bacterium]
MTKKLTLLIVDDEPLARSRLVELLADIADACPNTVLGEAENGLAALRWLQDSAIMPDVVLADIHMPGMNGLELAGHLGSALDNAAAAPAIIFTTAYDNHAVQAFELNAVDYLLKPVRAARLQAALEKVSGRQTIATTATDHTNPTADTLQTLRQQIGGARSHLTCHERGRLLLVPVADVLYFKADLKYVTARTREREFVLDEAVSRLETEFSQHFVRLHRSALVAWQALAGFERARGDDDDAYGYALLHHVPEKLPVSRRQWGAVKSERKKRANTPNGAPNHSNTE